MWPHHTVLCIQRARPHGTEVEGGRSAADKTARGHGAPHQASSSDAKAHKTPRISTLEYRCTGVFVSCGVEKLVAQIIQREESSGSLRALRRMLGAVLSAWRRVARNGRAAEPSQAKWPVRPRATARRATRAGLGAGRGAGGPGTPAIRTGARPGRWAAGESTTSPRGSSTTTAGTITGRTSSSGSGAGKAGASAQAAGAQPQANQQGVCVNGLPELRLVLSFATSYVETDGVGYQACIAANILCVRASGATPRVVFCHKLCGDKRGWLPGVHGSKFRVCAGILGCTSCCLLPQAMWRQTGVGYRACTATNIARVRASGAAPRVTFCHKLCGDRRALWRQTGDGYRACMATNIVYVRASGAAPRVVFCHKLCGDRRGMATGRAWQHTSRVYGLPGLHLVLSFATSYVETDGGWLPGVHGNRHRACTGFRGCYSCCLKIATSYIETDGVGYRACMATDIVRLRASGAAPRVVLKLPQAMWRQTGLVTGRARQQISCMCGIPGLHLVLSFATSYVETDGVGYRACTAANFVYVRASGAAPRVVFCHKLCGDRRGMATGRAWQHTSRVYGLPGLHLVLSFATSYVETDGGWLPGVHGNRHRACTGFRGCYSCCLKIATSYIETDGVGYRACMATDIVRLRASGAAPRVVLKLPQAMWRQTGLVTGRARQQISCMCGIPGLHLVLSFATSYVETDGLCGDRRGMATGRAWQHTSRVYGLPGLHLVLSFATSYVETDGGWLPGVHGNRHRACTGFRGCYSCCLKIATSYIETDGVGYRACMATDIVRLRASGAAPRVVLKLPQAMWRQTGLVTGRARQQISCMCGIPGLHLVLSFATSYVETDGSPIGSSLVGARKPSLRGKSPSAANRPSRPHITRVAQRKNYAHAQQDCEGGYIIISWVENRVSMLDFIRPFTGTYKGVSYRNSAFPPPRYFPNPPNCRPFAKFISDPIQSRIASGAVSIWGRVGSVPTPYIVMPFTIEPSKPRLCQDLRYLNLWMKDCPFSLDSVTDVTRYVGQGHYQTKHDDKSEYDHVLISEGSKALVGFQWAGTLGNVPMHRVRALGVPSSLYIDDRHAGQLIKREVEGHEGAVVEKMNTAAGPDLEAAEAACFILCSVLVALGYFLELDKCQLDPAQCLEFLGLEADSDLAAFRLPLRKKISFATLRENILGRELVPVSILQKLTGKIVSFRLPVPATRLYCREMFNAMRIAERRQADIPIDGRVREEIEHWHFLDQWEGHVRSPWRAEQHEVVELYSDASGFRCAGSMTTDQGKVQWGDYWQGEELGDTIAIKETEALRRVLAAIEDQRTKQAQAQVRGEPPPRVAFSGAPRIWVPAANCTDCGYPNDFDYNFCQRCSSPKRDPSQLDRAKRIRVDNEAINQLLEQIKGTQASSAYATQKSALKALLSDFLSTFSPPKNVASASTVDVVKFLIRKDEKGKTKVHEKGCVGRQRSCQCPARLAFKTVDSYIGKLRAIFSENGRGGEWDERLGVGNPAASKEVKQYLASVTVEQLGQGLTPQQARPVAGASEGEVMGHVGWFTKQTASHYMKITKVTQPGGPATRLAAEEVQEAVKLYEENNELIGLKKAF
ncbi:hypothetical protein Bbelb_303710 [Branchiostoma belcheri]|nr:hypothetical protein Bbelb_303710 [Branchiostoma belcheri]